MLGLWGFAILSHANKSEDALSEESIIHEGDVENHGSLYALLTTSEVQMNS